MTTTHHDGYQLDDLREAIAALVAQVDGLEISVDWTGDYETTFSYGPVPVVEFTVDVPGRPADDFHTVAVPVAARHIAHAVEEALGKIEDEKILALVEGLCQCQVD